MKKRIITLVLSALAVVLLVGVGFASWVVSQGAEDTQTGNILVETVKDERVHVVIDGGGDFSFSSPELESYSGWLTENDVDADHENLHVVFNVTVTRPSGNAFIVEAGVPTDLNISAELLNKIVMSDNTEKTYPSTLFDRDGEPVISAWTFENENKTAKCTITINLKWGTLFGGHNPYEFFNEKSGENYVRPVNGKLDATTVTALNTAELTYLDAAFTAENTWGDFAYSALKALEEYNNSLFSLKVEVHS